MLAVVGVHPWQCAYNLGSVDRCQRLAVSRPSALYHLDKKAALQALSQPTHNPKLVVACSTDVSQWHIGCQLFKGPHYKPELQSLYSGRLHHKSPFGVPRMAAYTAGSTIHNLQSLAMTVLSHDNLLGSQRLPVGCSTTVPVALHSSGQPHTCLVTSTDTFNKTNTTLSTAMIVNSSCRPCPWQTQSKAAAIVQHGSRAVCDNTATLLFNSKRIATHNSSFMCSLQTRWRRTASMAAYTDKLELRQVQSSSLSLTSHRTEIAQLMNTSAGITCLLGDSLRGALSGLHHYTTASTLACLPRLST